MSQALDQAPARKIRETGGPTVLDLAAIPNGFLLERSGTTVIGIDPAGIGAGGGWGLSGNTIGADKVLGSIDASGGYAVKMFVENQELMRMVDDGDHMQWTGPRLKIGHTGAAFYPNGDVISIKKNVGDQVCVNLQNTHNDVADPSGSAFILVNNDGTKTGGINMMNDDWPSGGSDGVSPGDYACIAFGGPAVYGTQTAQDVRFIANNDTWAQYDQSIQDFILKSCNLKVPSGIIIVGTATTIEDNIAAIHADAKFTLGTAGSPINEGGIKAGKSTDYWFLFNHDADNGYTGITVRGKSGVFARNDLVSGAASGSGFGAWERLINADGKALNLHMPESGATPSYIQKPGYATISVPAGYGINLNVNGAASSGFQIDSDGTMQSYGGINNFGSIVTFNVTPQGGDTVGSLGGSGNRWGHIWVQTTHIGDIELDDEAMDSHWTIREAKFVNEDPRKLYAIDRVTGRKSTFVLEAA